MSSRDVLFSALRTWAKPGLARLAKDAAELDLVRKDPVLMGLEPHRKRAMEAVAERFQERAEALHAGVLSRDPEACARFDALMAEAILSMRAERPLSMEGRLSALGFLDAADRFLYRDEPEWLDDPNFPEDKRTRLLDRLDAVNQALGIYDSFLRALRPLVDGAWAKRGQAVRIHDLASGHAGFALRIKREFGERVRMEASDIKPEYLEIGRRRAAALGLDVSFFVEDALSMDGVCERGVDIVTCTQSIHHFPPGMVARMMGEAHRAAEHAVLFIDGQRSLLALSLFVPAGLFLGRNLPLVRDGIVSLRRMYYKEELALLAALSPGIAGRARVVTERIVPAHGYVLLTRE